MRFYLAEIAVLESPQVESGQQGNNDKCRYPDFQLSQELLPENASVAKIAKPHPVGDESDQEDQHDKNDCDEHEDDCKAFARSSALSLEFLLFSSCIISSQCQLYDLPN